MYNFLLILAHFCAFGAPFNSFSKEYLWFPVIFSSLPVLNIEKQVLGQLGRQADKSDLRKAFLVTAEFIWDHLHYFPTAKTVLLGQWFPTRLGTTALDLTSVVIMAL